MQVSIGFAILGVDYFAMVDVKITSPSYGGHGPSFNDPGSPPEGCEWEIDDIELHEETTSGLGPVLEVPAWLRGVIDESDKLRDAVSEGERELPRGRRSAKYADRE